MKYAVKTDIGKRVHNEDNYLFSDKSEFPMLFAVADGMGGHAAGASCLNTRSSAASTRRFRMRTHSRKNCAAYFAT